MNSDWTFVADRLHFNGKKFIGHNARWEKAYLLADGFGQISKASAIEQCWDWSHVRESSDEAISAVAKFLKKPLSEVRG